MVISFMVSNLEINEIKKEGPINIFSPCVYKGTFCLKEERLTPERFAVLDFSKCSF